MVEDITSRQGVADKLRELRKEAGLSHQELADKCGMQKMNIIRAESGKHSIGIDVICIIISSLGKRIKIV